MKPYIPVPSHVVERLEIAILTGERLDLHWADEESNRAFVARVLPQEVLERDGRGYLRAVSAEGEEVLMRLDLIRNLPTPVK